MDQLDIDQKMRHWRHDFHAHPEMAYKEQRTSDIVASHLEKLGYTVHRNIAVTGIVAVRQFGEGPSLAIRADMDALPIKEATDLDYRSSFDGVMHACGHDGHTAILMGAAEKLIKRNDLSGTLHLVFQPAEENEGGARAMVEAGLFDQFEIDAIFGLHNMPGVPIGTFQVRAGTMSAAFDTFDISIVGKGGHGALPELAKDPVPASAALVSALNTITSRNVGALESGVVTIGQIWAGETYNVIPGQLMLKGSCRSLSAQTQKIIQRRIEEICNGIATAFDVEIHCDYQCRYPAVVNSDTETTLMIEALQDITADQNIVTDFDPVIGSEDFAFFLEKKPGCYFIMGNGLDCGDLHSATYDFNDDGLAIGSNAWVALAERFLKSK